jgi:hypothetical protein
MTDNRSPLCIKIMNANRHAYTALVVDGATPALAREQLGGVEPAQLLTDPKGREATAQAMLAGLWLWHDGLAESHAISQNLNDATGSFWHAIMHRREGDFSNSKYWYARAAGHPAFAVLAAQAAELLAEEPADRLLPRIVARGFDPNALVDLIETVHDNPRHGLEKIAVALQQLEWRALFNSTA